MTDARQFRADNILRDAGQWLRIRDKAGRPPAFGIPSSRHPSHVYLVRPDACTCPDSAPGHHCMHRYACAAHVRNLPAVVVFRSGFRDNTLSRNLPSKVST